MQDQDKNLINHQASGENQPTVIEANWTSNPLIQAKINYRMSGEKTDKYWLAWLIEDYFQGKSFDHLLSIGCGEGHHEILMAKLGFAEHIDAFDPNPENINLANQQAKSAGLNINFYQDNIEDFSIQDNQQYDIIFCAGVLHRINQLEKCLQNLKNYLKSDGYLIINEYIGDCYHIYNQKQVAIIDKLYRCFHPSLTTGKIGQFINRKITNISPDDNNQATRSKLLIPFLNN
ncbi:MAG: class I SAM-dependent methyltransferase, partial [Microcoleaceae cyanobacterium]